MIMYHARTSSKEICVNSYHSFFAERICCVPALVFTVDYFYCCFRKRAKLGFKLRASDYRQLCRLAVLDNVSAVEFIWYHA